MIKRPFITNREGKKGFALIEILIVIGIFSIIALMSIPFLVFYRPSLQLAGLVRELASDLRYAQQLAVTEQIEYGARISSHEYSVIKFGEGQEITIKTNALPQGIEVYEVSGLTNNEIRFNPYGAVKESGAIILRNIKNENKTIEIKISGFVRIQN